MANSFAALVYRPAEVSERALSRGFAVALAGWDVPSPHLLVAPLAGLDGWSVAFYASGVPLDGDGFEHAATLFEDELSPAVAVLDAATEEGASSVTVLTLVFSEDVLHDEAWRVTPIGFERHFVREGEEGIELGVETQEGSDVGLVQEAEGDAPDALERALRPSRGSTFLSGVLGVPVLAALMGALFAADRRVEARLVAPDATSIASATRHLNRVLGRADGDGSLVAPVALGGVVQPASHAAFARAYAWEDPRDPADLYRGLALGGVVGTLRFLRPAEIEALQASGWALPVYPIARLIGSALGGAEGAIVALASDGERLVLVRGAVTAPAGPTFGELLVYMALGWSRRTDAEEDLIGALMLRARVRTQRD